MAKPNLPVVIFLQVLVTQVIAWIGKSLLQDAAFSAYSKFVLGSNAKKQRELRKQVLIDKAELAKTSSQDEFAKWARLKRKLDKGLEQLEKENNTINASKASFAARFGSFIWFVTTGLQLFVVWWYRKDAVFWLPNGWVPRQIAWLLRWPSAPKGAVSSAAWATVCRRVLQSGEEVVKALKAPAPVAAGPIPVPVPVDEKGYRPQSRPAPAKIEELPDVMVEELD